MQEPNTTPREGINRSNGRAGFCFSYSIPTESIFFINYYFNAANSKDNKASIYASCRDNTYKFINIL